ncbi:MAG: hypothetical protein RBT34_08760 [Anaerolineaceae bacterium]|nr:hypothetical protein [Anaerolineaceae bacterium]
MNSKPISVDMLDAMKVQTELFALIGEYAPIKTEEILGKKSITKSNFWRTLRYRSVLLTFDIDEPENSWKFPYGWHIYFDRPTILVFSEKLRNPDKWEKRHSLDLENEFYFQLLDEDKKTLIRKFVCQCISAITSNSA